ncbi:hypothetical protein [Desulfovibrio sp. DV]|uniref:hypothetical protein n=1 Tax=Desulfovibrio sp. DV TaxID=1844708 RepID=UPI001115266D|nr:hypothetical protein [Desulfovibrio sp. DV]
MLSFKHESTIDYLKKERKHERTNSGILLKGGRFDRSILDLRETPKERDSVMPAPRAATASNGAQEAMGPFPLYPSFADSFINILARITQRREEKEQR